MIELTLWPSLTEPRGKRVALTWEALAKALAAPKPRPADPERPDLPGWSPATFREDRRAKDRVEVVTALVLDVDKGDVPLERVKKAIGAHRAVVHSTRRATPGSPRWRVVMATERPMTPDEHAIMWSAAHDVFSRHGIALDEATKDPSRFWFMPCEPLEGDYVCEVVDGAALDIGAARVPVAAEPREPEPQPTQPVVHDEPDELARITVATRKRRASAYLLQAEAAVSGEEGHKTAMRVVTAVVRGFALSAADARDVLSSWNARCEPPWSDRELAHKIDEASRVGSLAWGAKLLEGDKAKDAPKVDLATWNLLGVRALAEPLPPIPWLCEPIRLAPGAVSLVAGYGYSRKTMALQSLALSIATGRSVWGLYSCRRGRVVHLDYEQGKRLTQERYQRLARGIGSELGELDDDALRVACLPRVYLETQDAVDSLLPVVDGAALVIVDSLRAAFPHADENSSEVRTYLDALSHLSERTGACIVVIHHARKPNAANGGTATHAIRGSSALFDACQSVYVFEGEKDTPTTVHHQKDRIAGSTVADFGLASEDVHGVTGSRWGLRVVHLEVAQVEAAAESKANARAFAAVDAMAQKIVMFIAERGEMWRGAKRTIFDLIGGREETFRRAWARLEEAGVVVGERVGKEMVWRIVA